MFTPATDAPEPAPKKEESVILTNTSNLPLFEAKVSNSVRECNPKFIVLKCSCGRKIVRSTCMTKKCTTCKDVLGERRAQAALLRFDETRLRYQQERKTFTMLYTDFTIPPILRQNFVIPAQWQKLRTAVWEILRNQFGAEYALEATHPISEKHPGVFHPHLNFLWIQRLGFKPFLNVDKLADAFRDALNYKGVVNLHHDYSSKTARIVHWVNYVTRIFPEYADWAGQLRWYGRYPRKHIHDPFICQVCGNKYMALGYIDSYRVSSYLEDGFALGRAPPWTEDKWITPFRKIKALFESE